jgi:hypothetical protein
LKLVNISARKSNRVTKPAPSTKNIPKTRYAPFTLTLHVLTLIDKISANQGLRRTMVVELAVRKWASELGIKVDKAA